MNTIVFHPESDPAAIQEAAAILRRGGLVGIPTETVYGLGADALNEEAVVQIFLAKGRPQDNPLIIHVPDASWLEQYCRDVPPEAYRLAERFWPGPLTMILPRRDIVPLQTTGGLETVGVRCPDHPVTLAIIRAAGVPIAAPSGNTSGRPSPTTAAHMIEDMDGKIDGIVDGGPCTVGVESTIIDLTVTPPRLLRPGGLPLEALEEVLGEVAVDKAVTGLLAAGEHGGVDVGLVGQTYAGQQLVCAGRDGLFVLQLQQGRCQLKVLFHGQVGEQVEVLEHHAHLLAHGIDVCLVYLHTLKLDGAGGGGLQPVQAAQKGGFAAAGRANQANHVAAVDIKVDALQHVQRGVGLFCAALLYAAVGLGQAAYFQNLIGHFVPASSQTCSAAM